MLFSMIRASHERAGFHVAEPESHAFLLEDLKFFRIVEACDGRMLWGGAKVLANCENVTSYGSEVPHYLTDLLWRFSQPGYQT